jgi:hypothetical protein
MMGPMPRPVFSVDAFGHFAPDQLRIVWHDEPRPPHLEIDAMVAEAWERSCAEARRDGRRLFNGRLVRLLRHRLTDGVLTLDVGPTDYANFLGTNYLNHDRGDQLGWEHFGNSIGTTATVITSDGWLLYGRRSDRVACHPGYIHTFGGGLEADERRSDGTLDAFASVCRELGEELIVQADEVIEVVCLGLIRDAWLRQPELIFDARLDLTRSELETRIAHDHEQEHEAVVAVRAEPEAALPFLTTAVRIAPIAVGAVCLHGRRRFGEEWYASMMDELAGVDLDAAPPGS